MQQEVERSVVKRTLEEKSREGDGRSRESRRGCEERVLHISIERKLL